ncbi:MAG: hypothetical protein V4858_09385 [Pseudomonadota bacterium]
MTTLCTTPRALETRHPYMFSADNLEYSVPKGWFPIFAKLCEDIDFLLGDDKQAFHWTQLKTKFGSARFYWSLGADSGPLRVDLRTPDGVLSFETDPPGRVRTDRTLRTMKQITALVHAAEAATKKLCAVCCGEAATVEDTPGFSLPVCRLHTAERNEPSHAALNLWFGQDEDFSANAQ